jgi:hypothetical protein
MVTAPRGPTYCEHDCQQVFLIDFNQWTPAYGCEGPIAKAREELVILIVDGVGVASITNADHVAENALGRHWKRPRSPDILCLRSVFRERL